MKEGKNARSLVISRKNGHATEIKHGSRDFERLAEMNKYFYEKEKVKKDIQVLNRQLIYSDVLADVAEAKPLLEVVNLTAGRDLEYKKREALCKKMAQKMVDLKQKYKNGFREF